MSLFDPSFDDLPATMPIFPLCGVLLLPRGVLPLNIFEPRYLNMIQDALAADRMIGMTQPLGKVSEEAEPEIYPMGCAGRITAFEETDDGRFLINLKGICRFVAGDEIPTARGYRRVRANWACFKGDLLPSEKEDVDRERLFRNLKSYFACQGIDASWKALQETPDERLINSLSMICPFSAPEKQALLEAKSLCDRSNVLNALLEMAALDMDGDDGENTKQ